MKAIALTVAAAALALVVTTPAAHATTSIRGAHTNGPIICSYCL